MLQNGTIYDRISIVGHWWEPGSSHRVAGEAKYEEGNITLSLFGRLRPSHNDEIPIIHGETVEGRAVTVLSALPTKEFGSPFPGLDESPTGRVEFSGKLLALGEQLAGWDEEQLSYCEIRLPNLEEWLAHNAFTVAPTGQQIDLRMPMPTVFEVAALDGSVQLRSSISTLGGGPNSISCNHRSVVRVQPRQPKSVEWFARVHHRISQLMTLLVDDRQFPISWSCSRVGGDASSEFSPIGLFFRIRPMSRPDSKSHAMILFPFPSVEKDLGQVLSNWLKPGEIMEAAKNLFFTTLNDPPPYLEMKFLPTIQAIECFSRATQEGTYMDVDDFDAVKKALIDAIPGDVERSHRDALKSRIRFGNEHSLRTRLTRLLGSLEPETEALVCNSRQAFVGGVIDTRNYFIHYTDELRPKALRAGELHWANEKLKLLLRILFLRDAGLPEHRIRETLKRHGRYPRNAELWRQCREQVG